MTIRKPDKLEPFVQVLTRQSVDDWRSIVAQMTWYFRGASVLVALPQVMFLYYGKEVPTYEEWQEIRQRVKNARRAIVVKATNERKAKEAADLLAARINKRVKRKLYMRNYRTK